jgi:GT2 family glycosyltransferase
MSGHDRPVISVCIANYNGDALLPDCIDSVLAQQVDASVEIIVHDDASPDGSLHLLSSRYPQVRVIASPENVGFCVANNRMADVADGEYLLLLNNDAALDAGALQALLSEAKRAGRDAILTLPQYDWETGAPVDRGCVLDPFYNPIPNLDANRSDVAYVIGACLWIPLPLWRYLGGFPQWMGSIGEDMYLCCLARLHGHAVRVADGSRYRHRQGASFGGNRIMAGKLSSTYRRRFLSERNKTLVMVTCTPGLIVWPLLALHLLLLYAEGAAVALSRRDSRAWREIYAPVLPGLANARPTWKAKRAEAQALRRVSMAAWWRCFIWAPRKFSLLWRHGIPQIR